MGGDEFAAVFRAATPSFIQSLADGLCAAVREESHAVGASRIPATTPNSGWPEGGQRTDWHLVIKVGEFVRSCDAGWRLQRAWESFFIEHNLNWNELSPLATKVVAALRNNEVADDEGKE
jgi:GGDEF domain-containing protein